MNYIRDIRELVGQMPLILCCAGVIILDTRKRVLLMRRGDDNNWCIPGGLMEIGESVEETAKREVFEETNILIDEMKLFNIYSGENQHHFYPNGDEVYFVNVVFISTTFSNEIRVDGIESKEIKFFSLENMPDHISPANKPFIEDLNKMLRDEKPA